jgi:hypothetical protein
LNLTVAEMPGLFGLNRHRRRKHGLAAFNMEYRVRVGDLRWVLSDIHCGVEGAKS